MPRTRLQWSARNTNKKRLGHGRSLMHGVQTRLYWMSMSRSWMSIWDSTSTHPGRNPPRVQNLPHRRRYHQPQERRGRPEVGPDCPRCKFKKPSIVPGNRSTTWHSWWTTQTKSGNPRRGVMSSSIAGKDGEEKVDRHQGFRRNLRRAIRVGCRLGCQPSTCHHRSPGGVK